MRDWLVRAVILEMERIWGDEGFEGNPRSYDWLLQHYGVTREEDDCWLDILQYDVDGSTGFVIDKALNNQILAFVRDDDAVNGFLTTLLKKYRSSNAVFPGG